MLSLISWIITGLFVGLIARALFPGKQPMGFIMTVILGVVGAFVGGFIWSLIGGSTNPSDPANNEVSTMWPGWIMSVIGAMLVLWGYLALTREKASA